ncbi:MAG: septum site-determining protein MinC [bacterium]
MSIRLRTDMYSLASLHFDHANPDKDDWESLKSTLKSGQNFIQDSPVILDFSACAEELDPPDFHALIESSSQLGLYVAGCRTAKEWQALVNNSGVGWLPKKEHRSRQSQAQNKPESKPAIEEVNESAQAAAPNTRVNTLWSQKPLRSGQQTYHKNGDVILEENLSPGAEIAADGHIFVLGQSKGRIHAGANGNVSARIYCQHFDPELVSIAGIYQVSEEFPEDLRKKAVIIQLQEKQLCFKTA